MRKTRVFHVTPMAEPGRSLETFGGRLYAVRLRRSSRELRSVTQRHVADALGVTQTTVGRWEADLKEPDLATIARLAEWYGVSPGWLAFGEGEMIPATKPQPPRMVGTVPMDYGEDGVRAAEETVRRTRAEAEDRSNRAARAAAKGAPSGPARGSKRGR